MQKQEWLSLSEYSSSYRVSISTLRRRIKAKKAESIYEDGKYFLRNLPLKDHQVVSNTFDDLTHHQKNPGETAVAPPHIYPSLEPNEKNDVVLEQDLGQDISAMECNDRVSANVEYLLKELKNAYTLILKEKEEQIILLKDEMTDLRMLTKALESRCKALESNQEEKVELVPEERQPLQAEVAQPLLPEPIELDYIPAPQLELAHDWLDDEL